MIRPTLWRLAPTDLGLLRIGYGNYYTGFVVLARTEHEARALAQAESSENDGDECKRHVPDPNGRLRFTARDTGETIMMRETFEPFWTDPALASCEVVDDRESCVVMSSNTDD